MNFIKLKEPVFSLSSHLITFSSLLISDRLPHLVHQIIRLLLRYCSLSVLVHHLLVGCHLQLSRLSRCEHVYISIGINMGNEFFDVIGLVGSPSCSTVLDL